MKITISDQIIEAIESLPTAEMRAEFYTLYFAYVTTGAEPAETADPIVRAMFILAKPTIERLNRSAIKKRQAETQQPAETAAEQPIATPQPTAEPEETPPAPAPIAIEYPLIQESEKPRATVRQPEANKDTPRIAPRYQRRIHAKSFSKPAIRRPVTIPKNCFSAKNRKCQWS